MQPKIISKDTMNIAGLTGNGSDTGAVWGEFETQFAKHPFPKADENGYEIRFYDGEKPAASGKDTHVGFAANVQTADGFTMVSLPPTEYVVFDVYVAKGYDSGNVEMDKWLSDNSAQYGQRMLEGVKYVVESYDERFNGGDEPDSVVEIWIPLVRHCQSCYMPMVKPEDFGTETDGKPSGDYCCHCWQNGDFITKQNFEETVEGNIPWWKEDGDKSDDEARTRIMAVFPKLKRWKTA